MKTNLIEKSVAECLQSIPSHVQFVAAVKTRTAKEVQEAVNAGVTIAGHNYVQEAEHMLPVVGNQVKWHLIGHLQRNKVKRAVKLFDMIETIDSWKIAKDVDRHCADLGKIMPVLIEINSGKESNKTGILPGEVDNFIRKICVLNQLHIQGLMTMGPRFGNPEDSRPYFKATKAAFDRLARTNIPNVEMKYLSMGMSNSYPIAIEEGANMVRIGTKLFGER